MASQNIPVIGDDLANPATVTYHNFYPEGATQGTEYFYGLPRVAALNGRKTFGAIYCSEGVVCMQIANSEKQQAGRAGIKFLFSTAAAAASTSYTAQCLEAKNSNAQAVVLLLGEQIASRVAAACEQQGYHPQFLQGGNGFTQGEVGDASLAGVLGPVPDFPWFASDTPAMQQFQSAMRQYEPQDFTTNNTYGYSEGSALAWSSAKIFEAAAKGLPSGNVTGQEVMNALGNLPKNDTFGGLTPPITYAKNGPQPSVNCFFVIQLVNHRYSALDGDHPMCAS
jgi:branched-chain amino acid transport system substrate-binding protein